MITSFLNHARKERDTKMSELFDTKIFSNSISKNCEPNECLLFRLILQY